MRTGAKVVWVCAILLVFCVTGNVTAENIIVSPDWPDPFVAGKLIIAFTEEAIERIALALEQGVENGRLTEEAYMGRPKFSISDWDTRPWVTGIGAIDSLNRTYELWSLQPVYYDDPYGRKTRVFVIEFPEDTDILSLMNLYANLEEVEYAHPEPVGEVTALQLSRWGNIKLLFR
jgi:hypothetical protein